jgi:hypothetical protein
MEISVPAGIRNTVVSPASFPTTSAVSSALDFGTAGAWSDRANHLWRLRNTWDDNSRLGTSSKFRTMCCANRDSALTAGVPTIIQDAHAVTRLSLGMSS